MEEATDTTGIAAKPEIPLREYVVGEILAWLGRRRMSKAELARRLGHSNVMQLQRRLDSAVPFDVDDLGAIARILGIRVEQLLPDEVPADAGTARPLDLNQIQAVSAALGIPPVRLLTDRPAGTSPWYEHAGQPAIDQTPDRAIRRPRDSRPVGHPRGPLVPGGGLAERRPRRRYATAPDARRGFVADRVPA